MKKLTLHEKITIKGILQYWGLAGKYIAVLNTKSAIHYWNMCMGTVSIFKCFTFPHKRGRIK